MIYIIYSYMIYVIYSYMIYIIYYVYMYAERDKDKYLHISVYLNIYILLHGSQTQCKWHIKHPAKK